MSNYDSSAVGVPFVRAHKIMINYPPAGSGQSWANIDQSLAVKLLDGTVVKIGDLPQLTPGFDLVGGGNTPIPLVSQDTGLPLDQGALTALAGMVSQGYISLNLTMLCLLAVIRREQLVVDAP